MPPVPFSPLPSRRREPEAIVEVPFKLPMPLAEALALAAASDANPERRLLACEELIQRGDCAPAIPALREMAALPKARQLMAIARFVERAVASLDFAGARAGPGRWQTLDGSAPGASTEPSGVLLWLRPDARQTVLAFSTLAGGFGPMRGWNSVYLVHRFLARFPVNIVYLRDETYCLNLAGNLGLGADYRACVARLAALFEERKWRDVYAIGLSNGGFAALRYGLDLSLRGVLSFSGPTTLESAQDRAALGLEHLHKTVPHETIDLVHSFRRASRRPRLLLCHGEKNAFDTAMAKRMSEFSETELIPLQGFSGHSTFMEASRLGQLHGLTARLLEAAR